MDAITKRKLIEKIISDYYEYGSLPDREDYNHGYADAAMNAISEIISIDDPELE